MITVDAFCQKILEGDLAYLLDDVLLADGAAHVRPEDIRHLRRSLAAKFGAAQDDVSVWVVGSAKLGFSITEKRLRDGILLPRYRTFSPSSDIDIVVVSPPS